MHGRLAQPCGRCSDPSASARISSGEWPTRPVALKRRSRGAFARPFVRGQRQGVSSTRLSAAWKAVTACAQTACSIVSIASCLWVESLMPHDRRAICGYSFLKLHPVLPSRLQLNGRSQGEGELVVCARSVATLGGAKRRRAISARPSPDLVEGALEPGSGGPAPSPAAVDVADLAASFRQRVTQGAGFVSDR